ncbi:alpha/beta fold hydrolase [Tessaracoccus antarcticus]|uniref:Alpha/beta fold hydrolase n=1 Tax=Tessaracoccus antarcticus TaxID=2479848 RepID=A0A3M0G0E0_9ACTN|nr:alpha/beta fold hydrolase [Tessaracoccus antarcticus]RMB58441.1 alpha/beta fold hydrolase [Tessaracoccus antarcticus]
MELTYDVYDPAGTAERVLVVAPSLGGNATHQWTPVADALADEARVVFVDLPGHAEATLWDEADEPTLQALAGGVADVIRRVRADVGDLPIFFAGLSISGAIGLHLALEHPEDLSGVAVLCSSAKVGEPDRWLERAAQVESSGTQQLLEETEKRWFTPNFRAQSRSTVDTIMEGLAATDDHSYAQLCRALAAHDMRGDLADIRMPLMVIAGGRDSSTPIENVELVVETVPEAELHVLPEASHQVTVASPGDVATLLLNFMQRTETPFRKEQADD